MLPFDFEVKINRKQTKFEEFKSVHSARDSLTNHTND